MLGIIELGIIRYTLPSLSYQILPPESNEAWEGKVPCPRTQHRNNVPTLGGGNKLFVTENPAQSGARTHTAGSDIIATLHALSLKFTLSWADLTSHMTSYTNATHLNYH